MRIVKTAPANREFFNEHGSRLKVLQLIGFAGQLLSAGSLYYAVYAIVASQLRTAGAPVLIIAALVTALLIELSNKALAKPAIKPLVVNSMPGNKQHTILNRAYLAGLIVVAALSYYLSAEGSKYLAADITAPAALVDTDSLQAAYLAQKSATVQRYLADTATVLQGYKVRYKAAEMRFSAIKSRYGNCTRAECLRAIARAQTQYATETAKVAAEQQQAINELRKQQQTEIDQLTADHQQHYKQAQQRNNSEKQGHQQQQGHRALLLIIITIVGQTALYFTTYLICVIEYGAGITYTIQPNEFWNLPSIINEFSLLLSWRTERAARVALANTLGAKPKERNTGIYYAGLYGSGQNGSGNGQYNGAGQRNGHVLINTKPLNGNLTGYNNTGQQNGQYNGNGQQKRPTSENNGQNGQNGSGTHETTEHETPESTERHRTAPNSTGAGATNVKRYIFVGAGDNCEQCGADYTRKTTRQRFCSDECRLNFHAQKHNGNRYEPGRKF